MEDLEMQDEVDRKAEEDKRESELKQIELDMQTQVFKRGLPRPRRFVMPEARSEAEQMILD